ncbi:MAG TPA: RsmE family RNA methyltransferase [Candidatus Acidoferrales bacterium]|nr:RsmE family RNA methyltransferase [Candidatus Acidoferrales bacterium]
MPHFFGRREGERVLIEGGDARHLALSLRARVGEEISVVEPEGRLLRVRLESVSPGLVIGSVVFEREHRPEPVGRVTLAVAMLPAAALEQVLARGTELGAHAFLLVQAERSIARASKPERWAGICREAAMLAGRLRVPEVEGPFPPAAAWGRAEEPYLLQPGSPRRLAELAQPRDLTLFVGPEGGWTDSEAALAGDRVLGLGPRNLRAETAALAGLAVALAVRGD